MSPAIPETLACDLQLIVRHGYTIEFDAASRRQPAIRRTLRRLSWMVANRSAVQELKARARFVFRVRCRSSNPRSSSNGNLERGTRNQNTRHAHPCTSRSGRAGLMLPCASLAPWRHHWSDTTTSTARATAARDSRCSCPTGGAFSTWRTRRRSAASASSTSRRRERRAREAAAVANAGRHALQLARPLGQRARCGQSGSEGRRQPAGMWVLDVSDFNRVSTAKTLDDLKLSFFDTSGPDSRGVHNLWFVDGEFAHLTTGMPDFRPTTAGRPVLGVGRPAQSAPAARGRPLVAARHAQGRSHVCPGASRHGTSRSTTAIGRIRSRSGPITPTGRTCATSTAAR